MSCGIQCRKSLRYCTRQLHRSDNGGNNSSRLKSQKATSRSREPPGLVFGHSVWACSAFASTPSCHVLTVDTLLDTDDRNDIYGGDGNELLKRFWTLH